MKLDKLFNHQFWVMVYLIELLALLVIEHPSAWTNVVIQLSIAVTGAMVIESRLYYFYAYDFEDKIIISVFRCAWIILASVMVAQSIPDFKLIGFL